MSTPTFSTAASFHGYWHNVTGMASTFEEARSRIGTVLDSSAKRWRIADVATEAQDCVIEYQVRPRRKVVLQDVIDAVAAIGAPLVKSVERADR